LDGAFDPKTDAGTIVGAIIKPAPAVTVLLIKFLRVTMDLMFLCIHNYDCKNIIINRFMQILFLHIMN
jgi:hypothetical protein